MKISVGIVLLVFVAFGQSFILECRFSMEDRTYVGLAYECQSFTKYTDNSTIIEEVQGTHLSGKGNADVESFFENSNTLTSIPKNLASFFPKLKAIYFYNPVLQLSSSDLESFPNLLRFQSIFGVFTNIDGDLFQHTRKLKEIYFGDTNLESVGTNLLTDLNELVYVQFSSSGCIEDFEANSPRRIQELEQKLLLQCPPRDSSTTSPKTTTAAPMTTTISTSTPTQCSVRCSIDFEVDELNSEMVGQSEKIKKLEETNRQQEETISEMSATIARQEDKLVELEKLIREINATP